MYVQCKMYVRFCRKWKVYNRMIIVENVSDEVRVKVIAMYIFFEKVKIAQEEREGGIINESLIIDFELLQ